MGQIAIDEGKNLKLMSFKFLLGFSGELPSILFGKFKEHFNSVL
jgi:hypothetical protein